MFELRDILLPLGVVITMGLVCGCSHEEKNDGNQVIKINVTEAEYLLKSTREIEGLLLTDSESDHFPGELAKVVYSGDSTIVLDTWKDPGLYVYDDDGKLIGAYAKRGSGPEEYESIFDMWVSRDTIYLLVNFPNSQIISLDRNLNFVNKVATEPQSQHFACGSEGKFFDRGNNAYSGSEEKLIYVSNSGKKEGKLSIPPEIRNLTFTSPNVFGCMDGDTVVYLPPLEPRLYFCVGDKVELACELDFGSAWPVYSVRTDRVHLMDVMQGIMKDNKIYSTNLVTNGTIIAVTFFKGEDYYIALIDLNDMSSPRVLRTPAKNHDAMGDLVAIRNGDLVFGTPVQLLTLKLKPRL